MMRHGRIPPQISLKNLNPKIEALGADGSTIEPHGAAWQQKQVATGGYEPRLALVHNVGAAGSNAAMIVREYEQPAQSSDFRDPEIGGEQTHVLGISAKSAKVVSQLREELIAYLSRPLGTESSPSASDVCYTMTARRQRYGHRIGVTGSSIPELVQNLTKAEPVQIPAPQKGPVDQTVFVFSGQGSQVCLTSSHFLFSG
jgi:acyl transferase domain-containing protein